MHFAIMSGGAVEFFEKFTELARMDGDVLPMVLHEVERDSVDSFEGVPECGVEIRGFLIAA